MVPALSPVRASEWLVVAFAEGDDSGFVVVTEQLTRFPLLVIPDTSTQNLTVPEKEPAVVEPFTVAPFLPTELAALVVAVGVCRSVVN